MRWLWSMTGAYDVHGGRQSHLYVVVMDIEEATNVRYHHLCPVPCFVAMV